MAYDIVDSLLGDSTSSAGSSPKSNSEDKLREKPVELVLSVSAFNSLMGHSSGSPQIITSNKTGGTAVKMSMLLLFVVDP
jgi:hypothetical protein